MSRLSVTEIILKNPGRASPNQLKGLKSRIDVYLMGKKISSASELQLKFVPKNFQPFAFNNLLLIWISELPSQPPLTYRFLC